MIDFNAFSDELVKIAEELTYRRANGAELAKGIPLIRSLPKSPEKAREKLLDATSAANESAKKVLGYVNVGVPEKVMPNLKDMGFKETRIATPLPGEKFLTSTWRAGKLHAHKQGPFYLVHQDEAAPMGRLGYFNLQAIKHGVKEGLPSIVKRFGEKQALVRAE